MPASENAALARKWFDEVWNQRRDAAVTEMLAEPMEGHMEGGPIRTAREFLAARAVLLGAFPDLRVTVDGTIADGDEVAVRWSAKGTHKGGHMGPEPMGKKIEFRGITWLEFRGGRIVKGWDSWNLGRLLDEMSQPPAIEKLSDGDVLPEGGAPKLSR